MASEQDTVEINVRGLEKFIKAVGGDLPLIEVGILGSKNSRSDSATNAVVGAAHEFGSVNLPQRSFLRVPIAEHLESELSSNGAFDKNSINEVIQQGSLIPWAQKLALTAYQIVMEAFDTGGYGKWPALQPKTLERKKNKQILVETQQLRNSIEWKVE